MEMQGYEYAGLVIGGIVFLFLIRLAVGYYASRKVQNAADYIVAGRRLPIYLASASIMATWFAAETMMGASSTAYQYGLQGVVFDPFGAAACLFISGLFFIRLMRRARYLTVVDFFERRFGKEMSFLTSLAQLATYFAWTGAQIVAGGNIIHALLGWPVSTGMILVATIVTFYTFMGGMWADTLLDFMQMFLTAGGVTLIFIGVLNAVGGFRGMVEGAGSLYVSDPFTLLPIKDEGYLGYTGYIGIFYWIAAWLAIGFGSVPTQDLMQRSMAAKNEATSVWGSYIAGILYLTFGVMSPLIGIMMFKLNPNIAPEQTEFLLVTAAMNHLHPVLTALFIAALASALMSTSDSSVLAGASVVTENIVPLFVKEMGEKQKLMLTRIMVLVIGFISIAIALWAGTIYKLAMVAWSILLVGLFAPFAFGMYWKKANKSGAVAALVGGFVSWVILGIFYYQTSTYAICEADFECAFWDAVYISSFPAFIISAIFQVVVSLATQKSDPPMQLTDVDGNPLELKLQLGILSLKEAIWGKPEEEAEITKAIAD
ncbi:MAG: putative sodium-solute symporter [Anaerolineae bacterium]|jgi:SSS family transporter|nr:MAG: putative sodium-solute symporter [Anaerolineae bacterium]